MQRYKNTAELAILILIFRFQNIFYQQKSINMLLLSTRKQQLYNLHKIPEFIYQKRINLCIQNLYCLLYFDFLWLLIIIMRIQKKKFLTNIAKIKAIQATYASLRPFTNVFEIFHALILIFFIMVHSAGSPSNHIFASLKQISIYLASPPILSYAASMFLVAVCSLIFGPLAFLSKKNDNRELLSGQSKQSRLAFLKIASISSILFVSCAPICFIIFVTNLEYTEYVSKVPYLIHFITVCICEVMIVVCKQKILYSLCLIPLLFFFMVFPLTLALGVLTIISVFYLKKVKKEMLPFSQVSYLLVGTVSACLLVGELTRTCIGVVHLTIIIFSAISVVLISNFDSVFRKQTKVQSDNDYLLSTIQKLDNDGKLSFEQRIRLIRIMQSMRQVHTDSNENSLLDQIDFLSSNQIQKGKLIHLLKIKVQLDVKNNPNNLGLLIQSYQCELFGQNVSISSLYQIEKLNIRIDSRSSFEQIQRMQELTSKIEVNFLKSDDEINSSLIFRVEKKLERFYICIGDAIEEMLNFWKTIVRQEVKQKYFQGSLEKILRLEEESKSILKELKEYKDISFEADIVNYWHRIMNVSSGNYFQYQQKQSIQLLDTKFLLISNNIIEEISLIVAKQITFDRPQSLVGMNISDILYNFYNSFFLKQMDNLVSTNKNQKEMIIPFKIVNHDKMFIPYLCTFKILPSITEGVKYIINFIDKKEDKKKFILYCLETDTVQGFSSSFFQRYKIDEDILPQIISGQELFSTPLSTHIYEDRIAKDLIIRCQLRLNSIRKNTKNVGHRYVIPIILSIANYFSVNNINYILFQINSRSSSTILSAIETIQQFVRHEDSEKTTDQIKGKTFCKVRNPLESIIEDKISRTNIFSRISYFKISMVLTLVMLLLLMIVLIFVRVETATAGGTFSDQMQVVANTNTFVQTIHQLFYQYYQFYQINNFPDQILEIQPYDVKSIVSQYKQKVNTNIKVLLPFILRNRNPQNPSTFTLNIQNFTIVQRTDFINLINFLEGAKQALSTNEPSFLVKNQHVIYSLISSLIPFDDKVLQQFKQKIKISYIVVICIMVLVCLIIKYLHLKISIFKWNIFDIYSEITEKQVTKCSKKLQDFIHILVSTKYYDRKNSCPQSQSDSILVTSAIGLVGEIQGKNLPTSKKQVDEFRKGIKKQPIGKELTRNNFIFLLPLAFFIFFVIHKKNVQDFTENSKSVLQYSLQIQQLSVIILQRATHYFQMAMETILPQSDKLPLEKSSIVTMANQLHRFLPDYFDNYKIIQNSMLNFNMCTYAYLNTGSLYKGINCSKILDGMMDKGFQETYAFLLQKTEELGGASIKDLGKQFRPSATYPFYMEICYARRTINNMFAFIQTQFNSAVKGFFNFEQGYLETIAEAGFLLLPFGLILLYALNRQLRRDCDFAIKGFRILPRSFIMKISVSKKLQKLGVLEEIEVIAA